MPWIYEQRTGRLLNPNGEVVGVGYSGTGPGKNNPEMQEVPNVGPIPCGSYGIGHSFDSPTHGPFCLSLMPSSNNQMFGRSEFLMHGDSIRLPGTASQGCIVQSRDVREMVNSSLDRQLEVVREWVAPNVDGEIGM